MTPENSRPIPSVIEVPVARTAVGKLSAVYTLTAGSTPMPKNDMTHPITRTASGPLVNPKINAATAAIVPNRMITGRLPHRSTRKASAGLPGIDTRTMIAVKANAEVSVKPIVLIVVGMKVWIE